jgi:hypothetical protein
MAGILRTDTIQNSNTSTIITQTNSTTITIGTTGQTVALASGATSSGFGATYNGAVNWDTTAKTTGFTAVSGVGYFVDTTAGAITVTLPISPSAGAIVAITDYAGTAATNNITVGRNGSNIEGLAANVTISVNRDSITLVYVDSTQGWLAVNDNTAALTPPQYVAATGGTITTCGNFKIHTFTGPGTFTVSSAGNSLGSNSVDYMVTAGGGGAASGYGNGNGVGGGGAGGFRQNFPSPAIAGLPVTATAYPVTVGGGGSGGAGSRGCGQLGQSGTSGSPSVFSTITSTGGGFSGRAGVASNPGGSGGGGSSLNNGFGSGNTPPVSPPQGNNGGNMAGDSGGNKYIGGGGGGSSAAGSNGSSDNPALNGTGNGGTGTVSSINGSPVTYAGGGGGGGFTAAGSGGPGGGGAGNFSTGNGTAGTTNTGGGGGGGGWGPAGGPVGGTGGAGGSGIVVIRYKFQ